jgi:hypothetical protein
MAFKSQRVVPGRGGGSFPSRTQFEKVLGERLQYAAACGLLSSLGEKTDWPRCWSIVELMAEMASLGSG